MSAFEDETGLKMSFDDFTGVLIGMHHDVPAMKIDEDHQFNVCSFCVFAKSTEAGWMDCIRNKLAVNRLLNRTRRGLHGMCHLGLLDIAEPLVFHGRVLGAFYYGSVLIKGEQKQARERILRYCQRRGCDPKPYYKALAKVPVIEKEAIPRLRQTLQTVVRLAYYFCESAGLHPELYRLKLFKAPYLDPEDLPYVVKEAIRYVSSHLQERFIVKDLAAHLRCHPDFLSRKFKQYTHIDLAQYMQQARVERAKKLLDNPKLSIEEVAEQSGFSDRFHFSKVFRRVTGVPPGEFRQQGLVSCKKGA